MPEIIQFPRHFGATAATPLPTFDEGAPAWSVPGFSNLPAYNVVGSHLVISDGTNYHTLVGPTRQVELIGNQNIGGTKTLLPGGGVIDFNTTANLRVGGGTAGQVLSTDGAGNVDWASLAPGGIPDAPDAANTYGRVGGATPNWSPVLGLAGGTLTGPLVLAGDPTAPNHAATMDYVDRIVGNKVVVHDASMTGDGTTTLPLALVPANQGQIGAPGLPAVINNINAITPAALRWEMGLPASGLTTIAKEVVPAINEVFGIVQMLSGALVLIGSYHVPNDSVTPVAGSPIGPTPVALPAADPTNLGWYTIVSTGGTGSGNAPPGSYAVNDWLISNGTAWLHFSMDMGLIVATNVAISAIPGMVATNVQTALAELQANKLASVAVDGISIDGDGTAADAIRVIRVDGGQF